MGLHPHVSILILNYNGKSWLERFLPDVLKTSYTRFSVIVADNASSDDSCSWLKETYPQVQIIQFDKNFGFATGNNLAVQKIDSQYVVLLNSDVEVSTNWLEPLVQAMENNPRLAAVQPKIRSFYQRNYFEYAGASGGFIDEIGYPLCRGRLVTVCEQDNGQYDDYQTVFWATGACMLVRKAVINDIGLFEDTFFAHQEEIDFCWRAQLAGYQVAVEPHSVVYHVGGGTLSQQSPQKSFLNFRNNLLMLARLSPMPQVIWVIFIRLCLDGIAGLIALIGLKPQQTYSIFRAHISFYTLIPRVIRFRKQFKYPKKPLHQLVGVYTGWFLIYFFVLKIRIFSKLPHKIKFDNSDSSKK